MGNGKLYRNGRIQIDRGGHVNLIRGGVDTFTDDELELNPNGH